MYLCICVYFNYCAILILLWLLAEDYFGSSAWTASFFVVAVTALASVDCMAGYFTSHTPGMVSSQT